MHPKQQVQLATELLQRVLLLVHPADREVSAFFRENKELGAKDRAILAETTFRVLRQRLVLQHLAQSGQGPLARRLVLLAWQGSDAYLKAAVTEVEWNWLQQVRNVSLANLPERVKANMPPWLLERLQAVLGQECAAFVQAMEGSAPLDLRVNTFKAKREAVQAAFESQGFVCTPTPHSPWGLRLQGKPALNRLEVFARGDVEVQDEGSQLLALLEQQFKLPGSLSEVLRKVSALRVDADHKILNRDEKPSTYSEQFAALCSQATAAVEELAGALTPSTE